MAGDGCNRDIPRVPVTVARRRILDTLGKHYAQDLHGGYPASSL